jgi:ribosome-binding factor A
LGLTSGRRKATSGGHHGFGDRRGDSHGARGYPRSARVNEILREVLAEELERLEDTDERFGLLTITAVQCEPDLRHALVLLSSMNEDEEAVLSASRARLQAAISKQVRLKRTPQLSFAADPAVAEGQKIENIIRGLLEPGGERGERGGSGAPGEQGGSASSGGLGQPASPGPEGESAPLGRPDESSSGEPGSSAAAGPDP